MTGARPSLRLPGLTTGLAAALAAAAVGLAVASAARGYHHTWDLMSRERAAYRHLSPAGREQAFGNAVPLPMNVFDFYRSKLRPGDRYYLQVLPSGFGAFVDLPTAVRLVGHFYLLPAVEVADPARATVILSWETFPARLGLPYSSVERLGLQTFFVARPFASG